MYTVLSIAGPKSKELMDEMTGTDMSMHPFTYREVNVGYASGVMVLAVTNTGKRFGHFFFFLQAIAVKIFGILIHIYIFFRIYNILLFYSGDYLNHEAPPFYTFCSK
jgi:pyruvate dehydrogenase phosphatase regulatory subunit